MGEFLKYELNRFEVLEFGEDPVVHAIHVFTGEGSRHAIKVKDQFRYLHRYLSSASIAAETVVFENDYIDRHYLEDYSEYYSRCFHEYPRHCARLHFFRNQFSEEQFARALDGSDPGLRAALQDKANYCGYIVIRPIPGRFLGKICLRPYDDLLQQNNVRVIAKTNNVSLFGISLSIDSTPLIEQDKAVAACATSALWSFLHATGHLTQLYLPSASAITRSAVPLGAEGARTFPSRGLKPEQISRSLKVYGLEPSIFERDEFARDFAGRLQKIREYAYGYLKERGIPLLLGGQLYRRGNDGKSKYLGQHLVCVLGYEGGATLAAGEHEQLSLRSHSLNKLFVHDDRLGPYCRLDLDQQIKLEDQAASDGSKGPEASVVGLALGLTDDEGKFQDVFVPDLLILAPYHKVRVDYQSSFEICDVFQVLASIWKDEYGASEALPPLVREGIEKASLGSWEITLASNEDVKAEVIKHSFLSFNGARAKRTLLTSALPRYMWRCRLYSGDELLLDLLIDATDLAHGDIVLGCVAYSETAALFWQFVTEKVPRKDWASYSELVETPAARVAVEQLMRFVFASPPSSAALLFGSVRSLHRTLKDGESDNYSNVTMRDDLTILRQDSGKKLEQLSISKEARHIWLITADAVLVIGEDIAVRARSGDVEMYSGHPTLNAGMPSRAGGELFFCDLDGKWHINARSRAYPLAAYELPEAEFLNNVRANFFPNDQIEISCCATEKQECAGRLTAEERIRAKPEEQEV